MKHSHAIVWMDSKEARIFSFNADDVQSEHIKAHNPHHKVHHKAGVVGAGHSGGDHAFFHEIVEAVTGTREWLLVGPAGAKQEFAHYLEKHAPALKKAMVGIEAMDHPTDGQLLDHARRTFKAVDRMKSNTPG